MPLLYTYVFRIIADKAGKFDQEISPKLILEIWHRQIYHIPRVYDYYFLEEMQALGLIKKEQSQFIFYGSKIESAKERLDKVGSISKPNYNDLGIEPPLLYLHIYLKMLDVFGRKNQLLTGKQLLTIWRQYIPNISRVYDTYILAEMCNFGLLRYIDSQKYIFYGGKARIKLKKLTRFRLW